MPLLRRFQSSPKRELEPQKYRRERRGSASPPRSHTSIDPWYGRDLTGAHCPATTPQIGELKQPFRGGRTAEDDVHLSSKPRAPAGIEIGNVHRRLIFFAETFVLHIADDSDNRVPVSFGVVLTGLDSCSYGFMIREITPGHVFVDDKDVSGRGTIRVRKKTATKERDAKSGEVVRADGNLGDGRRRLAGRAKLALDVKRIRKFEQVGRQAHGYAHGFNTGRILDALKEHLVERNN